MQEPAHRDTLQAVGGYAGQAVVAGGAKQEAGENQGKVDALEIQYGLQSWQNSEHGRGNFEMQTSPHDVCISWSTSPRRGSQLAKCRFPSPMKRTWLISFYQFIEVKLG